MTRSRTSTPPSPQLETPNSPAIQASLFHLRRAADLALTAIQFTAAVETEKEGFFEAFFSVPNVSRALNGLAEDALENFYDHLQVIEDALVERGALVS